MRGVERTMRRSGGVGYGMNEKGRGRERLLADEIIDISDGREKKEMGW